MNSRLVFKSIGTAILVEAGCLLPSLFVALYFGENYRAFLYTMLILAVVGFGLTRLKPKIKQLYPRDGFAITALSWILLSAFGALPFVFSGTIPNYIDALFETISGFTTTGSTILTNVETMPQSLLFWRSFTHWIGGMGVLVLMLAIMPSVRSTSLHIMKAESTGPSPGKVVPRLGDTAKILWVIYTAFSTVMVLLLLLGGMPLFDSLIHMFGTAGTGGFSNHNLSIGHYENSYFSWVITAFMVLFGVNFSLYWAALKGNLKTLLKDEELRFYLLTILAAIILISVNLSQAGLYQTVTETVRHASFQVSTIVSTTGFSTTDFNLWPVFSKIILVLLMFIGSSAGSTAGGIKCVRFVILFKVIRREITRITHPRSVRTILINGRSIDESLVSSVLTYFGLYICLTAAAVLAVAWDSQDLVTATTAVFATINNIGPGLAAVGPVGSFQDFSHFSKLVLSACMLIGRLEIYPILLLFLPSFWKRQSI